MRGLPPVSVVVLNYNGRHYLDACFRSLQRLDYPRERLELILVDNASTDGSVDFMTKHFPRVRIVQNRSNVGFARGNNIGARAARGDYVAFLNNDTRVDRAWAQELVRPLLRDDSVVCTGSKMVDWEGKTVDFVKGVINFYGHGHQKDFGKADAGGETEAPILFACGGAMVIDRTVFLESGGFDEDYFLYCEDVDLGWRLWLMGYEVILVPTAITYHRQHGTTNRLFDYQKTVFYERNALYSIIKNYEQETLNKILPVALLLTTKRMKEYMEIDGVDFGPYHISHAQVSTRDGESVSKLSLAPLVALNEVIANMPTLMQKRKRIQERRRRSDAEIFELFGRPFHLFPPITEANTVSQYVLAEEFGIAPWFESMQRKVLVISFEPWLHGSHGAGDGNRTRRLCRALECQGHEVLLATPGPAKWEWSIPGWDGDRLIQLVHRVSPDIVVACGAKVVKMLRGCPAPLVFYAGGDDAAASSPARLVDVAFSGPVEEIIEPLDRFCRRPTMRRAPADQKLVSQKSLGELIEEAWYHYRRGGLRVLIKETRGFMRRRLR